VLKGLSQLTIIIPTYERHNLLLRAIEYYKSWNCQVIICDSSESKYKGTIPNNFQYFHSPKSTLGNKIYNALENVDTKYTCLSPDDDFLAKNALSLGINFLDNNKEYMSVQGNIIEFKNRRNKIQIKPVVYLVESNYGYHINSDDILRRIKDSIGRQHEYGLHRTFVTKKCMNIVKEIKAITPVNVSFSLISSIYGKHLNLPVFWQARDLTRYTSFVALDNEPLYIKEQTKPEIEDPYNYVVMNWKKYLLSSDGKKFKNNFINETDDIIDDETFRRKIFDEATETLSVNELSEKKKIRYQIKQLVPQSIWAVYTSLRDSGIVAFYCRAKYKHKIGYPWSSSISDKDWQLMSKTIINHRRIF